MFYCRNIKQTERKSSEQPRERRKLRGSGGLANSPPLAPMLSFVGGKGFTGENETGATGGFMRSRKPPKRIDEHSEITTE